MTTMICTFKADGLLFGVPVDCVQEVLAQVRLTPVPRSAPHVAGLINLRGTVVCAVGLRERMGLPASSDPVCVVVRTGHGTSGILADSVEDVLEVSEDTFEDPPSTMGESMSELVTGIYKMDNALIGVLDVDAVLRGEHQ